MFETSITGSAAKPVCVAVVGLGALGTEVILRMAGRPRLGATLKRIILIDPERIERRNIALSPLYQQASQEGRGELPGRFKAEVVAEFLQNRNMCPVSVAFVEFADVSWHVLREADVFISCPDNALARAEVAYTAHVLRRPMLDGGVLGEAGEGGRVTWFSPAQNAACYLCGLAETRRADLLAYAFSKSLSCAMPANAAMGETPFVTASLQRTAAAVVDRLAQYLETLQGSGNPADFLSSWADRIALHAEDWTCERLTLPRSATCPWHNLDNQPLVAVQADESFEQALTRAPRGIAMRLQFAWPLCVLARCRRCGARDVRPKRVALVRRHARCETCGAQGQLEPLQTVSSVGVNEPMAKMTPRQLGWDGELLLQLRPALVLE